MDLKLPRGSSSIISFFDFVTERKMPCCRCMDEESMSRRFRIGPQRIHLGVVPDIHCTRNTASTTHQVRAVCPTMFRVPSRSKSRKNQLGFVPRHPCANVVGRFPPRGHGCLKPLRCTSTALAFLPMHVIAFSRLLRISRAIMKSVFPIMSRCSCFGGD